MPSFATASFLTEQLRPQQIDSAGAAVCNILTALGALSLGHLDIILGAIVIIVLIYVARPIWGQGLKV